MYQTALILLVKALTTIIVTVVTVRLTMTGQVVSSTQKEKLRATARTTGAILAFIVVGGLIIWRLVVRVRRPDPVSHLDVLFISLYASLLNNFLLGTAILTIINKNRNK
jgi:hypothetical protein